jgi:hypothetical protein
MVIPCAGSLWTAAPFQLPLLQSESELLCDRRFTASQFVLAVNPLRITASNFISHLNTCGYSFSVTPSLTRAWVCHVQMLLVLLNTVILRFGPFFRVRVSYFTTGGLPPISSFWKHAPWDSRPAIFFQLNTCDLCPYVTSSLTRGWVCRLQILLILVTAVILRSQFRRTHRHILLSQIRDFSNLEDQVPVLKYPGTGCPSNTPRHWIHFSSPRTIRWATVDVFDPASTRNKFLLESEPYVTTDGQSASLVLE